MRSCHLMRKKVAREVDIQHPKGKLLLKIPRLLKLSVGMNKIYCTSLTYIYKLPIFMLFWLLQYLIMDSAVA